MAFNDPDGKFLHTVIGSVAGGAINVGVKIVRNTSEGKPWNEGVGKAALVGAVAAAMGATAATGVPTTAVVVGGAIGGATGGALQGAGNDAIVEGNSSLPEVVNAAADGAIAGAVAGGAGGFVAAPAVAAEREVVPALIDAVASEASAIIDLYTDVVEEIDPNVQ